jgi:DNA-binding NarL/FixJ family response regulator
MQPRNRLSRTEAQIAELVWQGLTNREISRAIGTTEQVVKNNLREVFDKLGVWSRLELAIYVAAHGGANWQEVLVLHPKRVIEKEQPVLYAANSLAR